MLLQIVPKVTFLRPILLNCASLHSAKQPTILLALPFCHTEQLPRCASDPTTTATSSSASNCFSHFCLNTQPHKGQPEDAVNTCLSSLTAHPGAPLRFSKVRTSSNAFCATGTEGKYSLRLFKIPFTALSEVHRDVLTHLPDSFTTYCAGITENPNQTITPGVGQYYKPGQ